MSKRTIENFKGPLFGATSRRRSEVPALLVVSRRGWLSRPTVCSDGEKFTFLVFFRWKPKNFSRIYVRLNFVLWKTVDWGSGRMFPMFASSVYYRGSVLFIIEENDASA